MPAPRLPRSRSNDEPPSPARVRDALAFIPPDLPRDEWVKVGMALKSALSEAEGFDTWNAWSASGQSYKEADARSAWRSFKAGGPVTAATLFGMARDRGWKPAADTPGDATPQAKAAARAAADAAALEAAQRREREAVELAARQAVAADRSAVLWQNAKERPPRDGCPYLKRKGVKAHGLRFLPGGVAVVPMRDGAGKLWSVQRLLPEPLKGKGNAAGSDKLYGPPKASPDEVVSSRKSGLWHMLGHADGAELVLLAEGYATAATLFEATGLPVAVCFDAGNLVHVARELRQAHPAALLLLCGDDDAPTEARTGKNPGRMAAERAAAAVRAKGAPAAVALPQALPEGGKDWNDLHRHAGLDAVRLQIERAIDVARAAADVPAVDTGAAAAPEEPRRSDASEEGPKLPDGEPIASAEASAPGLRPDDASSGRSGRPSERRSRRGRDGAPASSGGGSVGGGGQDDDAQTSSANDGPSFDPFVVDSAGVWFVARDNEGNEKRPVWVCGRLDVPAFTRADDANGWGYLLQFSDRDGNAKTWAMPSALLSGEGAEWAGRLRDMGLPMAPGSRARNLVAQYIDTRNTPERVTCTDRVGWHGPVYVMPSGCIGPAESLEGARRYVFQSDAGMEDTFRRCGELADWQREVSALARGNSRLVFAVCVALGGPLLHLAGLESGGVHFRGDSSQGKTTALRVAASVWGRPSFMQRWRTTDNALEAMAAQHCDSTLILDELGQLDPKVAGECAYMLANGQEKGRATRGGLSRRKRTWRLLFLSSGEISLADHMAAVGKRAQAGQEVRMVDVPLDAGAGMGGLETCHQLDGGGALAEAITSAAAKVYGVAGRAWLEWLTARAGQADGGAALAERLRDGLERIREGIVPAAASQQVRRVGSRFGLIGLAGELATEAGITGWPEGEARQAAKTCFDAWLVARGHLDNGEDAAMLRRVRQFLELHAEARFTWWHRALDDHAPKTMNRAGFRRLVAPDGKPVRTDPEHLRQYGERISASDAEQSSAEYMVLPEVFRSDVCAGFDAHAVAKLLQRRGHLEHERDRLTIKHRLPGMGKAACYHVKPSIFTDDL